MELLYFKKYILLIFYREEGRRIELEISMREKHQSAASCTPATGDMPATKGHALDRYWTWDLSVHRPRLYPLSQTGFGRIWFLLIFGERGREKHRCENKALISCLPHAPQPERKLGMCPDQELNLQPLSAWDDVLTNWATRPGQTSILNSVIMPCFSQLAVLQTCSIYFQVQWRAIAHLFEMYTHTQCSSFVYSTEPIFMSDYPKHTVQIS